MPAARYWRATGISAYAGGDVELSAFHLIGTAGSRVDQTATLSCAFAPISGALSNLQDTDTSTTARFDPRSPGFAFVWDFGSGNTADIQSAAVGSATSRDRFLSHYDLQYSSDGQNWTHLLRQGRFDWPGTNAMQTPSVGDLDYDKVAVLLYGNGANGSTTFTDSGPASLTFTPSGSVSISTAQSKYGGASMFFAGGQISTPQNATFAFGTGDFCIEFWAWKSANGAQDYDTLLDTSGNGSANGGYFLELSATRGMQFWSNAILLHSHNFNPNDSTWHHYALSREGTALRFFIDGVLATSTTSSANIPANSSVTLGRVQGAYPFAGYVDDFRVTKGAARYTENFTPPAAQLPLGGSFGFVAIPRLATRVGTPEAFAASPPVGAVGGRSITNPRNLRDLQYAGRGRISGTVKEDIDPVDRPVRRRVRLVRDRDGIVVRETWSNPTTGAYEFNEIDENATYSAISYDHTNNYRAVIADNLTPTVP